MLAASIEDAPHYVDSYLDAVFDVNIPKFGLDGPLARKISNSLARNIGTAATFRTIASDAGLQEEASSEKTVAAYLNALSALYMVEEVTGWDAPIRSKSRLRTKPKRYFSDPSIAVSLLQVSPQKLLEDGQLFGLLFESLCMHDLAVYCSVLPQASPHSLHYYRDSDGLEIDAIIELRDGRWAAFEVKLGEAKVEDAFKNLTRLRKKIALNPAARNPQPEFVAVLVGAGEFARYDKAHDAYVIPLTALGA